MGGCHQPAEGPARKTGGRDWDSTVALLATRRACHHRCPGLRLLPELHLRPQQVRFRDSSASILASQFLIVNFCVYSICSTSLEKSYNRMTNVHCEQDSLVFTCNTNRKTNEISPLCSRACDRAFNSCWQNTF